MLYTFADWELAINRIPHDGINPIIGLALDEQMAMKMHNIFGTLPTHSSTVRSKEGPYLAVRSCKKLNKAELVMVRAVMFGVQIGSRY